MNEIDTNKANDLKIEVGVQFEKGTISLSQKQMAELFDKDTDTIGLHLKNISMKEELDVNSTTEFFPLVQNRKLITKLR